MSEEASSADPVDPVGNHVKKLLFSEVLHEKFLTSVIRGVVGAKSIRLN
jgi:hypothetical protein